jgi:hypothetical protein
MSGFFGTTKRPYGLGGSPNSTEALFTNYTLPFFTKPLAQLGNWSPIIDTAKKNVIVK